MPKNNARSWAAISVVITLIGAALILAGLTIEDGDYIWMFAVGIFVSVTFLICFFVFMSQAKRLDRMFKREELLACWQFDTSEQQRKAIEEYNSRKAGNRILLLIVVAFFVVIGGLFTVFGFDDIDDAAGFLLILLSILAIISAAALLSPGMAYRKMSRSEPVVYVGPFGAWVMGVFTLWKAAMTRARQIIFEAGPSGARITVEYEIRQRYTWQQHTCRIPVPTGSEQQAYQVANQIAAANGVPFSQGPWQTEVED